MICRITPQQLKQALEACFGLEAGSDIQDYVLAKAFRLEHPRLLATRRDFYFMDVTIRDPEEPHRYCYVHKWLWRRANEIGWDFRNPDRYIHHCLKVLEKTLSAEV